MQIIKVHQINPENPIEVEGRNGYFKLSRADIWEIKSAGYLRIEFFAKKSRKRPPALIQGPPQEIKVLLQQLLKAVDQEIIEQEKTDVSEYANNLSIYPG